MGLSQSRGLPVSRKLDGKGLFFSAASARRPVQEKKRPLQCRFFPLAPHLDQYGNLLLIYHSGELPYDCPLINERIPLNHDFIKATYTVWSHLIRDPLIFDLVEMDSDERTERRTSLCSSSTLDPVKMYSPLLFLCALSLFYVCI